MVIFIFLRAGKNAKDLNNSAFNGSRDIHLGLSTTMAMTRKKDGPLSLTDLLSKEKRDRQRRIGTKGRSSLETVDFME